MRLPTRVDYPVVAVSDVHGQLDYLDRLLQRLERLPEWGDCALVFVGDFMDRGPKVRETLDRVLGLIRSRPSCTAVMGNHDLAPLRAARLDGGPPSAYWTERYLAAYDFQPTFRSYLGREADTANWPQELDALRAAVPAEHREFLTSLPWVVEAPGHLFIHCGLSPDLEQSAETQLEYLRQRRWDATLTPKPATRTARLWQLDYPVWLGADKRLSKNPLPYPGKVQVTGHIHIPEPDANAVRIRIDTSGGLVEPLTACLLRSATTPPLFVRSTDAL
jgi:serine/threonine protein phosphatase 1